MGIVRVGVGIGGIGVGRREGVGVGRREAEEGPEAESKTTKLLERKAADEI